VYNEGINASKKVSMLQQKVRDISFA